jgi:N-acetylglutamate synthase-like GNAT family acetyltransferase
MTEALEFRRATSADRAVITELVRAAYQKYVPRMGREPAPMSADYASLAQTVRVWLLESSEGLVGVLVTETMPDHVLVENIAVLPSAQGRGIASQLLARAELDAREAGVSEIRLYTNAVMTENLAFYPRRGFTQTHRATQYGFDRVFFSKRLSETSGLPNGNPAHSEDRRSH